MFTRKLLAAALCAAAFGAVPMVASADVWVDVAPPPVREEVIPAPRAGYVWAPGYWDWRHGHHVWVRGHWERERHGMYWHPSRWEQRDGRWAFVRGGWHRDRWNGEHFARRDRDGDGVPDRFDRAPNNPNYH